MPGVGGGMGIMAGPAGPAFLLVDMHEMQVLIAVSEPCKCLGALILSKGFFMAHETELVVLSVICVIEYRREILPQYAEVFGAVRVMAAGTVIFLYGAVPVCVFCKKFLHVSDLAGLIGVFPVMTAKA